MIKLYELSEGYRNILNLIEDGAEDEDIKNALETIKGALEEKVQNVAIFVQSMGNEVEIIKAEEKRLAERRKAIENKQKAIKEYIQYQMELAGLEKVKTATHTIRIQNNPPAVHFTAEDKIPGKFMTLVPEQWIPDKKKIAEALKSGETVEGAELKQGKSLRIS